MLLGLAALLGVSSAMCSTASAPPAHADAAVAPSYSATGTVRAVDAEKKTILIMHNDIPGFMKAMTMLFELRDGAVVNGVAQGDKVSFTFTDEGQGRLVVQSLLKNP
jgi:protein SCO1/2